MPVILLGALGGMAAGRHPRHVRRRDAAGARLPDLHGLGRDEPGCAANGAGRRTSLGRLKRCRPSRRSGRRSAALVLLAPRFRDFVHGRSRLRAPGRALARRLVQRCAAGGAGGRTASATDAGRRVVAQLRRPGSREAGRGSPAPQPRRAHGGHAHPRGARPARHRRQRPLPATAAAQCQRAVRREGAEQRPRSRFLDRLVSGSTSAGSWTSGASSGAASRRRTPAISRASRSTTTSRCSSRRRPRASTPRFARSSCGCASRTRTPRCRSAASRSPSACSAAATSPSSTCSRRARST